MLGGKAWCHTLSIQPLPTPGFLEEEQDLISPGSHPLPVFDAPTPQVLATSSIVIKDTIPSVEVMKLHFTNLSLEDCPQSVTSSKSDRDLCKKDDGLFAPIECPNDADQEFGPSKARRTSPPRKSYLVQPPPPPPQPTQVPSMEQPQPLPQMPEIPVEDIELLCEMFDGEGEDIFDSVFDRMTPPSGLSSSDLDMPVMI